jgi:hypothetical protein
MKTVLTEIGWWDVYWINMSQDRDKWRAIVKMVMNFWAP